MKLKSKIIMIAIMIFTAIFSGCINHGFSDGQSVKTSLEYNTRMNTSYSGKIVLITNACRTNEFSCIDHYIITVYNSTLGSKQNFDEMDLVPN